MTSGDYQTLPEGTIFYRTPSLDDLDAIHRLEVRCSGLRATRCFTAFCYPAAVVELPAPRRRVATGD
jgi:hypothetical protein